MPAPIVVEVYAPQPRPQELAVLIAACSRAAAPNECVTSEARGAEPPLGVAIVRREGDRARIEVGLRSVASAEWSTRDLVFQAGDDELERYRAIGFTIGALVAGQIEPPPPSEVEAEPASPPEPPAPSPPEPPAPPPASAPAPARWRSTWFDLAGGVGLGLIPGGPRAGGALRAASELVPEGLFGAFELSYAQRFSDSSLHVRWLGMALGLGHPLAPRHRTLGVDLRLLLVLERLSLTVEEGGVSDGASRWKPGLGGAIDAHWQAAPPFGVVVSAVTHLDPARTVVQVEGGQAGETPALGIGGFVGLRLKLR